MESDAEINIVIRHTLEARANINLFFLLSYSNFPPNNIVQFIREIGHIYSWELTCTLIY